MADSYLPYQNPTTTDTKLDTEKLTIGANDVERERVQVAGKGATTIAEVSATSPLSGSIGLVVRNIPSGSQQVIGAMVISNIVGGTIDTISNVVTGSIQLDPLSSITQIKHINDGTITTVSSVTTGSIQLDPLSHVTVQNIKGGTLNTVSTVGTLTRLANIAGGTIDKVSSIVTGSIQTIVGSQVTVGNIAGGTLNTVSNIVTGSIQLDPKSYLNGIINTVNVNASVTVGEITGGTINNIVSGSIQLLNNTTIYDITNTIKTTASMTMGSIPGGTIDVVTKITGGSIQLDPNSAIAVIKNINGGTLTTLASLTTGSIQTIDGSRMYVTNVNTGTLATVASVTNLVAGSIQTVEGSRVYVSNVNTGTIATVASVTNVVAGSIQTVAGSQMVVSNIAGGTITSLTNGSVQLLAGGAKIGTVSFGPTLMYSVTLSTAGAGTTILIPAVASSKIKVFAFDLTTTANTLNNIKFRDGLVGGGVLAEYGAVSATLNLVSGISKAVNPPAYLFATTAGNTLSMHTSAANALQVNMSYWTADAV